MSEPVYCTNHPNTETYLRCNRCESPICPKCAIRTEVGYRCRNCINQQQQVFYGDFRPVYYLVAAAVALPLSFAAGWIIPDLGWFTLFMGPAVGIGIAEAANWAIRRRRGQYLWLVVTACVLLGGLPKFVFSFTLLFGLSLNAIEFWNAWPLIWSALYLFSSVGSAVARLRPPRHK